MPDIGYNLRFIEDVNNWAADNPQSQYVLLEDPSAYIGDNERRHKSGRGSVVGANVKPLPIRKWPTK